MARWWCLALVALGCLVLGSGCVQTGGGAGIFECGSCSDPNGSRICTRYKCGGGVATRCVLLSSPKGKCFPGAHSQKDLDGRWICAPNCT
jgi:hypothetical protein